MNGLIIQDNYFIEYTYTDDGRFVVELQELEGDNGRFIYSFKIIQRTPDQYKYLIDDAIFCHELFKLKPHG